LNLDRRHIKFSVVISIFVNDDPTWFSQAFKSVLEQSTIPNEIVVAQDGELTRELLSALDALVAFYSDEVKIKVVTSLENVGRGEMLRRAVIASEYDFVAIMDADDISHRDRFTKQLELFDEDQTIDVIGSWVNEVDPSTMDVYAIKQVPENHKSILKYSKLRNPVNQMTVMFRKHAAIESGNYEHLNWFEDYWLWCRMLNNGCVFYNIPEALVTARAGPSMHSRRLGWRYGRNEIILLNRLRRIGFLSWFDYFKAVFLRVPFRLLPQRVYSYIFSNSFFRSIP